jgi:hypothetical protein
MSVKKLEEHMRLVILASVGALGLGVLPSLAGAVPATPQAAVAAPADAFMPVAEGCGHGYHWVGRYRRSDGTWIPGHCEPNP